MTEENHGPLFSGTEKDLYRTAFENVTAREPIQQELVALCCENCGKPVDNLTRCNTCLFYWCDSCIGGLDHKEQHRLGARSEERA